MLYQFPPLELDVTVPVHFFRTLAEFWHWFVGNIPSDSIEDGEVIFDRLDPLVLPDGDGDHR